MCKGKVLCLCGLAALLSCAAAKEDRSGTTELRPPILEYDFSEGVGGILKDKSPNGNNGTIHGAGWVKEEDGSCCLSFDGVDDYVSTPFHPTLALGQEFTVEMMVKPGENLKKEGVGHFRLLFGQKGSYWENNSSFAMYMAAPNNSIVAYFRYGLENTPKNNQVVELQQNNRWKGKWIKISFVKDLGQATLYVDTVPVRSVDIKGKQMIRSKEMFCMGGLPGRYFNGLIKSLKIYDCPKHRKFVAGVTGDLYYSGETMPLVLSGRTDLPAGCRYRVLLSGPLTNLVLENNIKYDRKLELKVKLPKVPEGEYSLQTQLCGPDGSVIEEMKTPIGITGI